MQTSDVSTTAAVGEFENDNTIILDSEGNQTTLGELKSLANFQFSEDVNPLNPTSVSTNIAPSKKSFTTQAVPAYGKAWPYKAVNSIKINCYAYALNAPGVFSERSNPGDSDGVSNAADTGYFTNPTVGANQVLKDLAANGLYYKSGRILSSRTAAINSDEYRIAFRVGWIDANKNGKVDLNGADVVDYHFMLQNSTGKWSEKHGQQPSINSAISDPSSFSWDLGDYKNFYNSSTVYIAVKLL